LCFFSELATKEVANWGKKEEKLGGSCFVWTKKWKREKDGKLKSR